MDAGKITYQVLDFQKNAFNNSFNAIALYQEKTEEMAYSFLENHMGIPSQLQKNISMWSEYFKENQNIIKQRLDNNFKMLQSILSGESEEVLEKKSVDETKTEKTQKVQPGKAKSK